MTIRSATSTGRTALETVLEEVDRLLVAHGLEVVEIETGGDWHNFRIEKRKAEMTDTPVTDLIVEIIHG